MTKLDMRSKEIVRISYRFHFLDHRNHLRDFKVLKYTSDDYACEAAKILHHHDPVEVWQGTRFVCRFDHAGLHFPALQ